MWHAIDALGINTGQKLMSDKQKLEATIKELRKAIKSKGEELKLLTEEKSELQKKADDFERELKAAAISYETSVSKIAQMRAMTQDTAALNVELQKDKDSDMFSFARCIARILKNYIPDGQHATEKTCPECGTEGGLIYVEGCVTCTVCGYAKCG